MLEIKNISCGYGSNFSLKDISLLFKGKEMLGIIGPNGSGKTTLLRALIRTIELDSGAVIFNGRDIRKISRLQLAKKIAVVSQDTSLQFDISVEEFISLGRIPHQERFQFFDSARDEEIVIRAMKLTGTSAFRGRLMETLSGGERQLVIIARALAQEPELLLLDEPTVYLDIGHQAQVLDLLRRLCRDTGLSIIIVLHELNLASEYCDKLLLLNKGMVCRSGTAQEVLRKEIIEEVYCAKVVVGENPQSKKPNVILVPAE